jgi:sucrose-6-phosphate hydrolase SacC (GH32 family)
MNGCGAGSKSEKDFSVLTSPEEQEEAYDYRTFFLPAKDENLQPYVGDPMPYYEDGTYYIYYLKDGGDSYNHSVYLATTDDFVSYREYDDPILESSYEGGQDGWIGTGSVVKVADDYYLFYTGHADDTSCEYKETIMVAKGSSPTSFSKVANWEITPPDSLGQKTDFRDPQAYYDAESGKINMTVTASQDNVARILKFTLDKDLSNVNYDGVIFTNPVGDFWNLECSDTFRIGDCYYITYSAQDDTLWYAMSNNMYGPYSDPVRLDGKLFYAAKHVENGQNSYMVGWDRRSDSPTSTQSVSAWAGNLMVQSIAQNPDGSLYLKPVQEIESAYSTDRNLRISGDEITVSSDSEYKYEEVFTAYESFLLKGSFYWNGSGSFGLAFDYGDNSSRYKLISVCPSDKKISLSFNEGVSQIAETTADLQEGREYSFTYIQEGSAGVFYIDGQNALTVRLYGVSGKPVRLFSENCTASFHNLAEYVR